MLPCGVDKCKIGQSWTVGVDKYKIGQCWPVGVDKCKIGQCWPVGVDKCKVGQCWYTAKKRSSQCSTLPMLHHHHLPDDWRIILFMGVCQ